MCFGIKAGATGGEVCHREKNDVSMTFFARKSYWNLALDNSFMISLSKMSQFLEIRYPLKFRATLNFMFLYTILILIKFDNSFHISSPKMPHFFTQFLH